MSAVEEIRVKLENRLSVLETEIESLRSALSALDSGDGDVVVTAAAAHAQPANGSKPPAARRARGSRRATKADAEQSAAASAELERLLAETGGLDAVELARQTGTDYGAVLARIRQLEQAGRPKG